MPKLNTRPQSIEVSLEKSAIVLVDMQNAFASKGGMLDIAGIEISDARRVVGIIRSVLDAARPAGIPVVHLRMAYKPDQSDTGGPNSPNWHKEKAMCLIHERPELKGKVLTEGTWDAAIVDDLAPLPSDIVITKTRYSGFVGTNLDARLRALGIQFLFFAGIATNVCVESTIRNAFFLEYWPIILADAAMPAGPPSAHEATLFNVESFFGWTMMSDDFVAILKYQISRGARVDR
ncbi:MAG: isochorismatase family protein [Candidatus Acidiferrales bacterium]